MKLENLLATSLTFIDCLVLINCLCDELSDLPSLCHCTFQSVITCVNVTEHNRVLEELLLTLNEYEDTLILDALKLVNINENGVLDIKGVTNIQIQTLEIISSNVSFTTTSRWDSPFWDLIISTYSLTIRDVTGLQTWDWSKLSESFPSLQYLQIDHSDIKYLIKDFASNFKNLLSFSLTNSPGLILGQRSLYCDNCKSIKLSNNSIEVIESDVLKVGPSVTRFYMDLRNNSLSRLDYDVFNKLNDAKYIRLDLQGNPLQSLTFSQDNIEPSSNKEIDIRLNQR